MSPQPFPCCLPVTWILLRRDRFPIDERFVQQQYGLEAVILDSLGRSLARADSGGRLVSLPMIRVTGR